MEGEVGGVETDETVTERPVLDGVVDDDLLGEDEVLEPLLKERVLPILAARRGQTCQLLV